MYISLAYLNRRLVVPGVCIPGSSAIVTWPLVYDWPSLGLNGSPTAAPRAAAAGYAHQTCCCRAWQASKQQAGAHRLLAGARERISRQKRAGFPRSLSAHARSAAIRCATAQRPPRAVPRAGQWRQAVHAGLPAGPRAVPCTAPRALPHAAPRALPRAAPRAAPRALPRAAPRAVPRAVLRALPRAVPRFRLCWCACTRSGRNPRLPHVQACAGSAAEEPPSTFPSSRWLLPSSRRAAAELAADGARTCGAPLSAARGLERTCRTGRRSLGQRRVGQRRVGQRRTSRSGVPRAAARVRACALCLCVCAIGMSVRAHRDTVIRK